MARDVERDEWPSYPPGLTVLTLDGAGVLALMADHHPEIGSWIDDSTWLECSCGWDSSKSKAIGWHEHLVAAVEAALRAGT